MKCLWNPITSIINWLRQWLSAFRNNPSFLLTDENTPTIADGKKCILNIIKWNRIILYFVC